MTRNILVRGARQLLTLHGPSGARRGEALRNLGIIEDGSVLIVNGAVASVGPTRRIENLAEARKAEEINATGHVVMPAFVDAHSRLLGAPARFLQFRGGQRAASTAAAALQYLRTTPAGKLDYQCRRYIELAVRHGTMTLGVASGSGLSASAETKCLRVLAGVGDSCLGIVPAFAAAWSEHSDQPDARSYAEWAAAELLPRLKERKLIRFCAANCDATGSKEARLWLAAAVHLGIPVRVQGDQAERTGAAQLAVEFNAASAEGLSAIRGADVDALSRSATVATLLPAVSAEQQNPFPPARELIDRGAAVALASGFDPSCGSTVNLQAVVALACRQMRMEPEEAISAVTINGAHALGLGSRCGSLEYGKDGDLLVLNVSDYREIPLHFGCAIVALAMRKGDIIYREGALSCRGG